MTDTIDVKTQIFTILNAMAENLGVAGAHLWGVLVKQEVIFGYWCMGASIGCAALLIMLLVIIYKTARSDIDFEYRCPIIMFGTVFVITFFVLSIVSSYSAISGINNPEYAALKNIIEKVHGA